MSELRRSIKQLAEVFAANVLKVLSTASLSDLSTLNGNGSSGVGNGRTAQRRRARVAGNVNAGPTIDVIVDALKKSPSGLRFEQLQRAVGKEKADLTRAIKSGIDANKIKKRGQRRGTTYFAA